MHLHAFARLPITALLRQTSLLWLLQLYNSVWKHMAIQMAKMCRSEYFWPVEVSRLQPNWYDQLILPCWKAKWGWISCCRPIVFTQTNEEHLLESMVYKFILQITASTGGKNINFARMAWANTRKPLEFVCHEVYTAYHGIKKCRC